MMKRTEDINFNKNYRDFLEGEHLMLTGDDGVSDVHEFLNRVKKEHVRRLAVIEDRIFYQQYGVGYYQGNVTRMRKELSTLLEDVNRRRFVDRLVLVDIVERLDLESLCVLKEIIDRRVQLVIVTMKSRKMTEFEKYCYDELKEMMKESASIDVRMPRPRRG